MQRISVQRVRALRRLVGFPTRGSEPDRASAIQGAGGAISPNPDWADLGRRIERLADVCQRPCRWRLAKGDLFVLPRWVAAGSQAAMRMRGGRALRIRVDASRVPRVEVAGHISRRQLALVTLSPRKAAAWRRRHAIRTAAAIRRDLRLVLGDSPKTSHWLAEMETAPERVEAAGIAIWGEFLAAVDAPGALRIPGAELSLLDLLTVLDGPGGGSDRVWFCNQWPAAAAALLRAGSATRRLREIDANRANAVKVAAATFCCQGLHDCSRARQWARRAPRFRADLRLAEVLAGHGSTWDVQVRCILMHANERTGGALLRRLASCSLHAREHAQFAVAAAVQPVLETSECRLAVGMLVIRVLAGSPFRTIGIEPADVASAFVAVSADCLAIYSTVSSAVGPDRLEAGVLACADWLSSSRPELSPSELFRFVTSARGAGIGVGERTSGAIVDPQWPAPAGWGGEATTFADAAAIRPLLSEREVRAEGEAMQNCLARTSRYQRQAAAGNLALFSIRVAGKRATLALSPVERHGFVQSYAIEQLAGPKNSNPPGVCAVVATRLVERLRARLPAEVAAEVKLLRQHLQVARRFNSDKEAAVERWRHYVSLLPKRFRSMSPVDVVKASEVRQGLARR